MASAGGSRTKAEARKREQRARTAEKTSDVVKPSGEPAGEGGGAAGDGSGGVDSSDGAGRGSDGDRISLTRAQLDALGWADARTDGEATADREFILVLSRLGAEQAWTEARRFVADYRKAETAKKQEQQRERRRLYRSSDGEIEKLTMEGDSGTLDEIMALVEAEADRLYRQDGGRDVAKEKHPRTRNQRLFDAAHSFFLNTTAKAKTAAKGAATRATLVLTTSVENAADGFPEPVDLIGTGPISRHSLSRILPDTDLAALLLGQDGHPLWLGRSLRHATFPQWLALAVRDRGCVLCGAKASRCQAHHVIPWESPAKGETNIDELCLLCGDCHQQLHHDKRTLEWDTEIQRWRPRPARPDELPPTRTARKHE